MAVRLWFVNEMNYVCWLIFYSSLAFDPINPRIIDIFIRYPWPINNATVLVALTKWSLCFGQNLFFEQVCSLSLQGWTIWLYFWHDWEAYGHQCLLLVFRVCLQISTCTKAAMHACVHTNIHTYTEAYTHTISNRGMWEVFSADGMSHYNNPYQTHSVLVRAYVRARNRVCVDV